VKLGLWVPGCMGVWWTLTYSVAVLSSPATPLDRDIRRYGLLEPQQTPAKLPVRVACAKNPMSSFDYFTESPFTIICPLL
jgi:hypothetical protein